MHKFLQSCLHTFTSVTGAVIALGLIFSFSAAPVFAATPVYGLNRIAQFEQLPYLQATTFAGGQSSFDRTANNNDWNNFLYTTASGEKVMLDQKGPGTVYRIWVTGFNASTDWIKVYFDGESTPRINMKMSDLFSGTKSPFLSPLVVDNSKSSGGFVSYLPLPYQKSVLITTNMSNYYNIGYHTYGTDAAVTTWNGTENASAANTLWNNTGTNPNDESTATSATGTFDLASGATQTLLDTDGPREVTSVKLNVAGMTPAAFTSVTDDGKAFKGYSQFTVALDPANQGVTLKRRLDFGVADQKAGVYVDGAYVGDWFTPGSDTTYHWRDSSFSIPASYTAGKSSATIQVKFVSAAIDWNEFYYWVYSSLNNQLTQTDTIDVGNTTSETAHNYTINTQTWNGTRTFTYPATPPANSADILNNTRIKIYYDNASTASVDAPVGSFFGTGQAGAFAAKSLPVGFLADGTMYVYFPMPFAQHIKIQLVSNRSTTTPGITYTVKHKAFSGSFSGVGYFKTQFNAVSPETVHQDIPILDTTGTGHYVGSVHSYTGPSSHWYLEGDERVYVDDSGSPAFQGTGTEDYFNAGWYFQNGPFLQPVSGNPGYILNGSTEQNTAYRFFLQDAIPFRKHIQVSIEHGATDETTDSAWTLAYYYQQPTNHLVQTDTLNVGNTTSERAHAYSIKTQTWSGSHTFTYEGVYSALNTNITDEGRAFKGYSQFNMAIQSSNNGVVLRRRFDQSVSNQAANVYVNGSLVGTWYHAGGNTYHQWRDEDFYIPASFTSGKTSITIKVQYVSSQIDWNEFTYWMYTLTP